jgi:hypothetical protein
MPDPFTPLHQAAAPHDSGHDAAPHASKVWSRWPTTLVAVLLFVTTTAAAVVATSGTHAPIPALWKQGPPSIFTKAPDGAEYRELLF